MKELIYNYLLENCWGKENATKGCKIREELALEIGDKKFRELIQEINASDEYMYLIGAKSGKGTNAGYFIATNKAEAEEVMNNIRHRANKMLQNVHVMEWKFGLRKKWFKRKGK